MLLDLEGLDEGPEEGPDALPLGEQLDEPHHPEEAEEGDGDHVVTRLERGGWGLGQGSKRLHWRSDHFQAQQMKCEVRSTCRWFLRDCCMN